MGTSNLVAARRSRITKATGKLRSRAAQLRREAHDLSAPLAVAYRRRASELEFQAEVLDGYQAPIAA